MTILLWCLATVLAAAQLWRLASALASSQAVRCRLLRRLICAWRDVVAPARLFIGVLWAALPPGERHEIEARIDAVARSAELAERDRREREEAEAQRRALAASAAEIRESIRKTGWWDGRHR